MAVETEPTRVRLKDLGHDEFVQRYGADRFTASVLANRMRYVVNDMCTNLLNTAFSPIVRDWYDFAAVISGPPELNYPMSMVSNGLALFLGTMAEAVRNTVEEYGVDDLRPGDVIMANDPYRIGNHVNDVCFIRPVFFQGRIATFLTLRAHQLDMGGSVPAGFSGTKRQVYENGLVISPTLLYREDRPIPSAFHLIFDNARFCQLLFPDIKSTYQALMLGERLILESLQRYGVEAYHGAIRYACDVAAEEMSEAIRTKVPDGVYEAEDWVDADGVDADLTYRIRLKLTKCDDRIEIDLSGTSKQARTSINCGFLDTKTSVAVALKMLLDPLSQLNSGSFRNVDFVIPPGTICSAVPPDGVIFMYWEASSAAGLAVYRALAKVLGENAVGGDYGSLMIHNSYGVTEDGVPWSSIAELGGEHGPWAATKVADGDSYTVQQLLNNIDPATEAIEAGGPVVLLRKEYLIDSGGAGTNRGGASVLKDSLLLSAAETQSTPLHTKAPSGHGVHGASDGGPQANWFFTPDAFDVERERNLLPTDPGVYGRATPIGGVLDPQTQYFDPDGEYFYFARRPSWSTPARTIFRYVTAGGGGWGQPLERDPERVLRDVRDEYVSIEGAERDYGVVVRGDPRRHPEKLELDWEATRRCRASRGAAAGGGGHE